MNGIEAEYFLGLFFAISSVTLPGGGKITADLFRLVAGVLLIAAAILGFAPIK